MCKKPYDHDGAWETEQSVPWPADGPDLDGGEDQPESAGGFPDGKAKKGQYCRCSKSCCRKSGYVYCYYGYRTCRWF